MEFTLHARPLIDAAARLRVPTLFVHAANGNREAMAAEMERRGAFAGLDEIWEYFAEDNLDAADRAIADIQAAHPRHLLTAYRTPSS